MEAMEWMARYIQVHDRFRKMNFSALHPGISHGEYVALEVIRGISGQNGKACKEGGCAGGFAPVSEMLKGIGTSPPALSRILKSLEQKGLVIRENDRENRRNIQVRLTQQGERAREDAHENMKAFAQKTAERVGEDRILKLIELENHLADVLQEQLRALEKGDRRC